MGAAIFSGLCAIIGVVAISIIQRLRHKAKEMADFKKALVEDYARFVRLERLAGREISIEDLGEDELTKAILAAAKERGLIK